MDSGTWFDVAVILLSSILGVRGLLNGFIKEIFGLIGLIGGGIVASRTAGGFGEFACSSVCSVTGSLCEVNSTLSYTIGLGSAWLIFWIVCLVAGLIISKMAFASGLGAIDRLFGFAFGAVKILFVVAIIVAIVAKFSFLNSYIKDYLASSSTYPLLLKSGDFIMNLEVVAHTTDAALQSKVN